MNPGFKRLLAQQLIEIKLVAATFDYSTFAGKSGPLSGSGCRERAKAPTMVGGNAVRVAKRGGAQ